MTFKIFSTSPSFGHYVSEPVEYFNENGCELPLVPQGKKLPEEELIENMAEFDAAIVGFDRITQTVIDGFKKLRVIAKHGAGVDNIDVTTATSFLSIHVPLIDSTRNLISTRELELMKKGAFLVNISRGGVVDEESLY